MLHFVPAALLALHLPRRARHVGTSASGPRTRPDHMVLTGSDSCSTSRPPRCSPLHSPRRARHVGTRASGPRTRSDHMALTASDSRCTKSAHIGRRQVAGTHLGLTTSDPPVLTTRPRRRRPVDSVALADLVRVAGLVGLVGVVQRHRLCDSNPASLRTSRARTSASPGRIHHLVLTTRRRHVRPRRPRVALADVLVSLVSSYIGHAPRTLRRCRGSRPARQRACGTCAARWRPVAGRASRNLGARAS